MTDDFQTGFWAAPPMPLMNGRVLGAAPQGPAGRYKRGSRQAVSQVDESLEKSVHEEEQLTKEP